LSGRRRDGAVGCSRLGGGGQWRGVADEGDAVDGHVGAPDDGESPGGGDVFDGASSASAFGRLGGDLDAPAAGPGVSEFALDSPACRGVPTAR